MSSKILLITSESFRAPVEAETDRLFPLQYQYISVQRGLLLTLQWKVTYSLKTPFCSVSLDRSQRQPRCLLGKPWRHGVSAAVCPAVCLGVNYSASDEVEDVNRLGPTSPRYLWGVSPSPRCRSSWLSPSAAKWSRAGAGLHQHSLLPLGVGGCCEHRAPHVAPGAATQAEDYYYYYYYCILKSKLKAKFFRRQCFKYYSTQEFHGNLQTLSDLNSFPCFNTEK